MQDSFFSLRMNKCLKRVDDRHFWTPGVFSYAIIPRGRPNSRVFGIYSVFGESVREGGCSPSLKTLKNRWSVLHPKCAKMWLVRHVRLNLNVPRLQRNSRLARERVPARSTRVWEGGGGRIHNSRTRWKPGTASKHWQGHPEEFWSPYWRLLARVRVRVAVALSARTAYCTLLSFH